VNDTDAVFRTFHEFRRELGGLDRVIVNAGVGPGARVGPWKLIGFAMRNLPLRLVARMS
jgi:NAD(P)-dependent dehydrogenase (short-subunit alcohol dehydrogenase family)